VKGIKKGIKKFHPSLYEWEGMCVYRGVTYLFGILRRARKNNVPNFEFWGRAQNIGGSELEGTCRKNNYLEFGIFT